MRLAAPGERMLFNPRFREPSPDVLQKLKLSRERAANLRTRKMKCPVCGTLVQVIPVSQREVVFVKCRKCKFTGPLDPAYFRRQKRYPSRCPDRR